MLVDTDVLIWQLRGYSQATRRLDELGALTLSAVSYLEVLQGMRNKVELLAMKKMLESAGDRRYPFHCSAGPAGGRRGHPRCHHAGHRFRPHQAAVGLMGSLLTTNRPARQA